MAWLLRLLWGLLALVAFFLAALAVNQDEIILTFLRWETPSLSVFWWLLGAFGCGLVLGLLTIPVIVARERLKHRVLSKRLAQAESELSQVPKNALQE